MKRKKVVIFLVGPTASGKSKLGIHLAKKVKGEIISADSMQIYKKMDIGTAKPSIRERAGIPHHMIDLISPNRNFSVFDFYTRAIKKIISIANKGKIPIVVGGTGLYVRALLQGIAEGPGRDQLLRDRLTKEAKKKGVEALHSRLRKKAPKKAARIKKTDLKRIIRALEIESQRKSKKSSYEKAKTLKSQGYEPIVLGITRPRETLYEDINQRVDLMFKRGLVREVRGLLRNRVSRTALQAVGYKELVHYFEGKTSLGEAKELIKRNSRRLAKRQMTWFRKEKGLKWITLPSKSNPRDDLTSIIEMI